MLLMSGCVLQSLILSIAANWIEEEKKEARPRLCDARKRREGLVGSEGGVGGPGPGEMDAVASSTQMERPQETQQDMMKSRLEEHQEPQRSLATGDSKDPGGGFTEDKHTPKARPELCTSISKGTGKTSA